MVDDELESYVIPPGTVIAGRYIVVRLMGQGSSKQVYLADDKLAGYPVALALLNPARSDDPLLVARFIREARLSSVLSNPYVVRVLDVGKLADGTRFLACEAVLGRGLDAAIAEGRVSPGWAAIWTMQVLAGLSEAHRHGVLHRDVKPQNVLLAQTPHGEIARLTDFGLAKAVRSAQLMEGAAAFQTAHNVVVGTPAYMSPEQWHALPLDGRTDVYSTGVMLYELLTGRPPFERRYVHAMLLAHTSEPPPPFSPRLPGIARALEPVVQRALAKGPDERFTSADEMRLAIESVTGYSLQDEGLEPPVLHSRYARADLHASIWPEPVRVIATPFAVIGRSDSVHVKVRLLPETDESRRLLKTVSRMHARIEWRGGRALISDLGSQWGTHVRGLRVGSDPVEISNGDEIAVGSLVRFRFDEVPAPEGELPPWARLVRTDEFGGGQAFVWVLTEAPISAEPDAAIPLPPSAREGNPRAIKPTESGFALGPPGSQFNLPMRDGQTLRFGNVVIRVSAA